MFLQKFFFINLTVTTDWQLFCCFTTIFQGNFLYGFIIWLLWHYVHGSWNLFTVKTHWLGSSHRRNGRLNVSTFVCLFEIFFFTWMILFYQYYVGVVHIWQGSSIAVNDCSTMLLPSWFMNNICCFYFFLTLTY